MKNHGFKLILISDKTSDIHQMRINRNLLYVVSAILFVGLVAGFFLLSEYYSQNIYTKRLDRLKSDNEILVDKILENEKRMDELLEQLESIKFQDNLLRDLVKLPRIHDDVRKVGVGGTMSEDDESRLEYLLPGEGYDLFNTSRKMDFINRVLNLEALSFAEMLGQADQDIQRYRSYPAIHPVDPEVCKLSSDFGMRSDPINRKKQFHDGHDFSGRTGTPVYATADGVVKASKYYGTFGNYIEIDHGYGYKTVYGHLSKRKVNGGEKITRGQMIGAMGNTGKSTAPHLHYGVIYKRKDVDPADFYFDLQLN